MKSKLTILLFFFLFVLNSSFAPDPTELIINGVPCGKHGNAQPGRKEYDQNVFKNRFDFPGSGDFNTAITLENIIRAKENETGFSQNKAVEIEGYVYDVKKGGIETCNCKATESYFRDTHIELTINSSETGPEDRVIVEVTPRFRQVMAEKGIDWTTENLRQTIEGKFIRIQGWLFYDFSHKNEAFAEDPDDNTGRDNWRASAWEVHPITSIELVDIDNIDLVSLTGPGDEDMISTSPVVPRPERTAPAETVKTDNMNLTASPFNILAVIILGAILGMVGQGLRVVVGLKKMNDTATREGISSDELFKTKQLLMSLFIAFAIGAIAGVLAAMSKVNSAINEAEIFAFVAAGYAGTDFIEGFMKKATTITRNSAPAATTTTTGVNK